MRRSLALALALVGALACGAARAYDPESLVSGAPGDLPILLTVPHDGAKYVGFAPVRANGFTGRDEGTRPLAERAADELQRLTGRRPYMVIAEFSRRYVDANRANSEAYEAAFAEPAYRAYHDRIASYISQMRARFPAGALLIDIHGQSAEPEVLFRGTRAGRTTRALIARFGRGALQGDASIVGLLAAGGVKVHPAVGAESLQEDGRFSGGFTVFQYGSHRADGIDAIQLEFGARLRSDPTMPARLADALATFLDQHGLMPQR